MSDHKYCNGVRPGPKANQGERETGRGTRTGWEPIENPRYDLTHGYLGGRHRPKENASMVEKAAAVPAGEVLGR